MSEAYKRSRRSTAQTTWCWLRKLNRVPSWADRKAIRKVYEDCPDGLCVDHIVPLNGNTVSGLHVKENLQYMSMKKNSKKNNKYTGRIIDIIN